MTVHRFASPHDFFLGMFGPGQHDAHVERYRAAMSFRASAEHAARFHIEMQAHFAELRERESQKLAAVHGYDTAALRRELHRYTAGCFMYDMHAKVTARQLGRALDIAIERAGNHSIAAE